PEPKPASRETRSRAPRRWCARGSPPPRCRLRSERRRAAGGQLFQPGALLGCFAAAVLGPRQGDEADGPANHGEPLDRRAPPSKQAVEAQLEGRQSLGNAPPDVAPSENNADTE